VPRSEGLRQSAAALEGVDLTPVFRELR